MPTISLSFLACIFVLLTVVASANITTNCSYNQYLTGSNTCVLCSSALDYCENCTSSPSCVDCKKGYFLNATQQCETCNSYVSNCGSCTAARQCDSCVDNTMGVKTTVSPQVCQKCNITLSYCVTCNNMSSCTSCWADPTIYLNINDTVPGECTFCNQTYSNCVTCTPVVCTTCINSTNFTLLNGSCVLCSIAIPNCLYCDSYTHCLSCFSLLLTLVSENGSQICKYCAQVMAGCALCDNYTHCIYCAIGVVVKNGCSDVAGCIQVYNIGYKKSICLTCRTPEFHYIAENGVCKCTKGHLTGSICTSLLGCTQTNPLNSTQCKLCSQRDRFQLVNRSCQCIKTFYLSGDFCLQVCGDGFLYDLACDDGNLIDGDGCSSLCIVEPSFICRFGTVYSASKCMYNQTVCLSLTSINKITNKNSLIIIFAFQPYSKAVDRLNYTYSLTFNSTALCNLTSIAISDTSLVLTVDYFQDLNSNQASVYLAFDQSIIASYPCFVSFTLEDSNGVELRYQQQLSGHAAIIQTSCSFLAIFGILLFLVGNFAHKMIGIQTIHTLQLVFLILVCSPNFRTSFFNFKTLLPALRAIKSFISASTNKSNLMYYLQFYVPYSRSFAMIGVAQLVAFLLMVIIVIKQSRLQGHLSSVSESRQKREIAKSLNDTVWYRQLLTDSYFFPIFIGFFFHFRLLLLNSYYNHYEKSMIQAGGLAFYCIINYIVFFIFMKNRIVLIQLENKNMVVSQKPYSQCSNQYILNYLIFIVASIMIIELQLLSPIADFNYIIAFIVLLKILTIITLRPYRVILHNVSILFNLGVVIFTIAWSMLDYRQMITTSISKMFQLIMIILLALVQLLCAVRIVLCFREHYLYFLSQRSLIKKGPIKKKRNNEQNDAYFHQFNKVALTTTILERTTLSASANINMHQNISKASIKRYRNIFMQVRKDSKQIEQEIREL